MEYTAKSYITVEEELETETVVKKSRFIARVFPVSSEEQIADILEQTKKKYWDARHNCYGYVLGLKGEKQKCSDDGEPAKTAGAPIMEVLKNENLTFTLAVVTRYFGGVLLGTGGLTRAYSSAVAEAIALGKELGAVKQKRLCYRTGIKADYGLAGKLKYIFNEEEILIEDEIYTDLVSYGIAVPVDKLEVLNKKITEVTNGKLVIDINEDMVVYL